MAENQQRPLEHLAPFDSELWICVMKVLQWQRLPFEGKVTSLTLRCTPEQSLKNAAPFFYLLIFLFSHEIRDTDVDCHRGTMCGSKRVPEAE